MTLLILMRLMIVSATSWAAIHKPPTMTVWSRDSMDHLRTKYPNERIQYLDRRGDEARQARGGYIQPIERDALIKKFKLDRALATHDEFEKDYLFMYLRDANAAGMRRMHQKYPAVSLAQMARIKQALVRRR